MCLCVKQYNRIIDCGLEIPLAQLVKELQLDEGSIISDISLNFRMIFFHLNINQKKIYNNE